MKYLIIGASGTAGQMSVQGVRDADKDGTIVGTTSRDQDVSGCDQTIHHIDLDDEKVVDRVVAATGDIDCIIYIPAKGPVGFPTEESTRDMIEPAFRYSVYPMLELMQALKPKLGIWFSGFITLGVYLRGYGAMGFTKIAMEQLSVDHADKLKIIRFGSYTSFSSRGVALLIQKNFARRTDAASVDLYQRFKKSGLKFIEFLNEEAYEIEEATFKHLFDIPFRPTQHEDVKRAVTFALSGTPDPVVNVIGDWLWTEKTMIEIPPPLKDKIDFIPQGLDKYLEY